MTARYSPIHPVRDRTRGRGRAGAPGRTLAAAVVAAAATLCACGCGSSGAPRSTLAAGAPIEIGYLASLHGFCATFARQYLAGAELAVRRIDTRGGVLGHPLRLLVRDDHATPRTGIAQAQKLVQDDHVKYLAGACTSAVAEGVAQTVANPSHVLYAVGASDPRVFAGGPQIYAFDTIPTATVEGRVAAAYMRAHPAFRRIAVIGESYLYGHQVTAAFKHALSRSGHTVVSQQYLPPAGADYTPYIHALLAAHPDAVYSSAITRDALTLVRQGLPLRLFARARFLGVADYATLAAIKRLPVGARGYTIYPSAAIYATPFARALRSLGAGAANGGAAGDAFNQIELIAQGIQKARSTDPTKVRDALQGASVRTVEGDVRVRPCDHTLTMPIALGTIVGPTSGQPFGHLEPDRLVDTRAYGAC
jgi:branched-chain amino acid transport system substrate-binding protein